MTDNARTSALDAQADKTLDTEARSGDEPYNADQLFRSISGEAQKSVPDQSILLAIAAANIAMANGKAADAIDTLIEMANRLGKEGRRVDAVELFEIARKYIIKGADQARLNAEVKNVHGKLDVERELFRQGIIELGNSDPEHKVVILSDSLALPRDEPGHDGSSLEETYPALIQKAMGEIAPTQVIALCRRYGTMVDTVEALQANKEELKGASVFIHVGLNDCASRTFMERERLAIGLYPIKTQKLIVEFGRAYRVQIIAKDPEYSYVPIDQFRQQLDQAFKIVKVFGGRDVTLATIVQPPTKFGEKTPYLRWNFSRYNLEIYEAAKNRSAALVDIDRLCWENDTTKTLISDGMHISRQGHALVAETFVKLWKARRGIS